jgi:hypothetical protein
VQALNIEALTATDLQLLESAELTGNRFAHHAPERNHAHSTLMPVARETSLENRRLKRRATRSQSMAKILRIYLRQFIVNRHLNC